MPPPVPLLDEQEFDQPPLLAGIPNHDINFGNNPFYYFTSSPWFEPMCINVSVLNNLGLDPDGQKTMNDRKLWDERLRRERDGVQFMIVGEPQGEGQPWVLQRQNKVPNAEDNKKIDTHVEGTWYFQGTRVLMAPSLLDVVQSRLLSVSTRMQQMAEISKNMTHWSPATGYSYFPPSYEGAKAATTTASRIGSPTLAPTDPDAAASQSQGAGGGGAAQAVDSVASTTEFSDALFMQSLSLTNAYGDEFMDENPLKGEPGAFVFENTRTAVDARNKAQEQAKQASQPASSAALPKLDTQLSSVVPSAVGTPKGIATPAGLEAQSRKGSIAPVPKKGKKDRAKSQGLTSPTTPSVSSNG